MDIIKQIWLLLRLTLCEVALTNQLKVETNEIEPKKWMS